jgi:DNA polymerase III sliding clamp (beta) subunit (PCNA family)
MPLTYETFMKHAATMIKGMEETMAAKYPVTKGVLHETDGSCVATDAHRLYLAREVHGHSERVVLTPTGKKIEGEFPNVSRLIPQGYPQQEETLEVPELLQAADSIRSIGIFTEVNPAAEFTGNQIKYASVEAGFVHALTSAVGFSRFFLNSFYLYDAMKLFKAAGYQSVTIKIYGAMRPVIFESDDEKLTALILPIRKY